MSTWDWIVRLLEQYWPQFAKGTAVTIVLAIVGTVAGFLIGLGVGIVRTVPYNQGGQNKLTVRSALLYAANAVLAVYIEVFRGTPMMVQAMLIYYGLPELTGFHIAAFPAGLLVITLNTGAYMSEIVRGGIHSVDPGQTEAAKAIGMTHWKTMVNVILPQAIRNILPATGNEFVVNLKDSSVLNIITVGELFYATKTVSGIFYRTYEPFLIAAAIYLVLTFVSSRLLRFIERRMDGPKNFTLIASSTTTVLNPDKLRKHGKT